VVVAAADAAVVVVDVRPGEGGVGDPPEAQAASANGAAMTNPNCSR